MLIELGKKTDGFDIDDNTCIATGGLTLFDLAQKYDDLELANLFIRNGSTIFHRLAIIGDDEKLEILLKMGIIPKFIYNATFNQTSFENKI